MTFLVRIKLRKQANNDMYPYSVPSIKNGFDLELNTNITFFVGENGSGKSTILEAIAQNCGFNILGGGQNNHYGNAPTESLLANNLELSRRPLKLNNGFFLRAESFFNFASHIDYLAKEGGQGTHKALSAYGGKSLHEQSHGESYLSLVKNRFTDIFGNGIYILDEPEAALSPQKILSLMSILHNRELTGKAQFIIATHSPILLGYPSAKIFSTDGDEIHTIQYKDTEHYKLTKSFLQSPETYFHHLFKDE